MPAIAPPLLTWYHQNRRILPFREEPSPYRVWVSEIMLQQTRVSAALPYFERFVERLPTPAALAACSEDELHKLWQGLGYYNRAKNLQKAAQILVKEYGGALPADYEALRTLPGIGTYTAGAIASIAFGLPFVAVDGNVLRVFSRLLASHADIGLPATKKLLSEKVQREQPANAPGDFNQALMELGALVCTPQNPNCTQCPLCTLCEANRLALQGELPVVPEKKEKKKTKLCVLVLHNRHGHVLLHRRPSKGLLAGLYEPLCLEGSFSKAQAQSHLQTLFPGAFLQQQLPESRHIFTHRIWQLYGWQGLLPDASPALLGNDYFLVSGAELREQFAVPNAFKAYRTHLQNGQPL